jgi:hypothetical protein
MERSIAMAIMTINRSAEWHEGLFRTAETEEDAMRISMHASLTAIGRQLKAGYRPTLAKPLPSKLKKMLARLVALEAGK